MADKSSKLVKAILETIREQAEYALKQLQAAEEERSMVWICRECGYTKHFTRPASIDATGKCPRCKNTAFKASN
jgi:rubrerythrin